MKLQRAPRWLGLLIVPLLLACTDPPLSRLDTTERGGLLSAALDDAGAFALVGTVRHGTSVWRLQDGARLYEWGHSDSDDALMVAGAFSPDSRHAVTAERNSVVLWDMHSGRSAGFWSTEGDVRSLALSDGGRRVLIGLATRNAVLIDAAAGNTPSFIPHAGGVNAVALSRDGRLGVTGSDDGMVRLWDLDQGVALFAWQFDAGVASVALSADGRLLFAAPYHGPGRIWQIADASVVSEIGRPRDSLIRARFSADGQELLTGSPSGALQLWNTADGRRGQTWQVARDVLVRPSAATLTAVAFGPDSATVVGALTNGTVLSWSRR